ncbi:unnamed protein product [Prorocentrum cordatum]|uniref:TFIIS central domain-containing protein n=1 Tax=Prorocentrum cordatum TaxID=2364126 RepID=A0ABN9SYE9_9DINO|nr:unnamed protein product [Polarella glacialis]
MCVFSPPRLSPASPREQRPPLPWPPPRAAADLRTQGRRAPAIALAAPPEQLAREASGSLLGRAFGGAGAEVEEAAEWTAEAEVALWSSLVEPTAPSSDASGEELAVALRHYRSEVRRVCGALRDPDVARGLLERLRDGSLSAASIAALPAEQLLPEAKRARLRELRAMPPEESGRERKDLPFEDPTMVCAECGKQGRVRFGYLVSVREGYGKAETWGSKDNEERGERCKAQCGDCLAEWTYDV